MTLTSKKKSEAEQLLAFSAVTSLMNGAQYDARRRFDILTEEIDHFLRYLRYRVGPSTDFGREGDPARKPYDSQQAFLVRLGHAAHALQKECLADGGEANLAYERFKSLWLDSDKLLGEPAECLHRKRDLLGQQVLWISKIVTKASVVAERLGELHDRLQQFLQRTNPDHPEPTLRRRLEHGLADKYLSELTRWVHKDVAEFCSRRCAGNYPMASVPSTFQFWGYGHASSHHSFVTLDEHHKERQSPPPPATDSLSQPRFTSIAFSYWIPERPALAPLIGHEIARQVLRAIYGRNTQSSVLEQDRTALGEAYRSLIGCAEKWLAESVKSHELPSALPMHIATDVLCDALAATRFGWSYVYALALQMMSDERFAALFEDSSGMLGRVPAPPAVAPGSATSAAKPAAVESDSAGSQAAPVAPSAAEEPTTGRGSAATQAAPAQAASSASTLSACKDCQAPLASSQPCAFCAHFSERDRDAKTMSAGLKKDPPLAYFRGRVLLDFVQLIHPCRNDPFAQELSVAFECLLDAILALFTAGDADRLHHWRQFAAALGESLCHTGPLAPSRVVHSAKKFVARTLFVGSRTNFVNLALARQSLSPSYRSFLMERLGGWLGDGPSGRDDPRRKSFGQKCCPGLVDVVWRIEWLVATAHKGSRSEPLMTSAQALRRRSREVLAMGIDDYLFRTGSPITLFETLNEGEPPKLFSKLLGDHNKLDNMREAYCLDAVTELDRHLERQRSQDFSFPFRGKEPGTKVSVRVGNDRLAWLPDRVVDVDWHNRWLKLPSDVEVRDSIVILDLLCLKSEIRPGLMDDAQADARSRALLSLNGELNCSLDEPGHPRRLGRRDAQAASDQQPGKPKSAKERHRYEPFASGSLLGRYDAFVFYTQGPTDTIPPTTARWSWCIEYGNQPSADVLTAYVSRSKRLVRIWGPKSAQRFDGAGNLLPLDSTWSLIEKTTTLGLVLVSLKWDASRTLVGRWLAQHVLDNEYGMTWAVFLSDGWEDLVVVAGLPKGADEGQLAGKYEKLVAFVEELNRSPFIASTETLFSQTLLKAQPSRFSFRFTVRLGRHRHEDVLNRILTLRDQHAKQGGSAEVRNVAGNRDIDVLVHPARGPAPTPGRPTSRPAYDLSSFHFEMRQALSGYAKFETRVAWTIGRDPVPGTAVVSAVGERPTAATPEG